MKELIIVTNNPRLEAVEAKSFRIERMASLQQVLQRSRDLVHQGARLVSHPLAGSLKPWQNPYRSIGLENGDSLDFGSLKIMEGALERYRIFGRDQDVLKKEAVQKKLEEDFSRIDLELITNVLPEKLSFKKNNAVRGEKIEAGSGKN